MDSVSSAQALARMCSNLDLITLSRPETEDPIASPMIVEDDEDALLGPSSPTPSLVFELEESEARSLLDSPTLSPSPNLTPSTPPPSTSYGASDFRDRMTAEQRAAMTQKAKADEEARKARKMAAKSKEEEEARLAKKRAKKAEKKKKAKEVKRQKKALLPQGTNWAKDKESEEAAKATPTPRPSTSGPSAPPPTPAPRTLAPYTIPRRTSTPTLAASSKTDTSMRKIASLMDLVVEHPYGHPSLLESPSPQASSGPPPSTTQRASRPPRTTSTPSGSKRDRSGSTSGQALGQDDLRYTLSNTNKRPKFVEPPPPKPSSSRSKNPSALLVIGQRIPKLIRDSLPARICEVKEAVGEINTSYLTLASTLNTFLLQHPAHHNLIILTDFPWWSMCLDDRAAYIKMMVESTKNICAHCHTHPSFRSCKFVCLNLYQDRASAGGLADSNLPWSREEFDKTSGLLESLNDPANCDKVAFPSLQPIYDKNKMEELFDPSNTPSPAFISSIRNFVGNLVYGHFGTP